MQTQPKLPQPKKLVDQPASFPLFYLLPQTHYVKRQRAANAPEYSFRPKAPVIRHSPRRNKLSLLQRYKNKVKAIRMKIWMSVKQAGRRLVHKLVRWCILPLSIAACLSIVAALPAELPEDELNLEVPTLEYHQH